MTNWMKLWKLLPPAMLICAAVLPAQETNALDQILEKAIRQENAFIAQIKTRTPLIETYVQETPAAGTEARAPRDHYFLGRVSFEPDLKYMAIATRSESQRGSWLMPFKSRAVIFVPTGFAQMMFIDSGGISRGRYKYEYVHREFLGDVRCLVFDLTPVEKEAAGRFVGRIWVEDREFRVVRFNGTYTKSTTAHLYFHFDSWRTPVSGDLWAPAMTYVEENASQEKGRSPVAFKAQVRWWGYNSGPTAKMDELTKVLIESEGPLTQKDESTDVSPLESQRSWERQAEENIIDRLEKGGMLAPRSAVDTVLDTVVNNLIVTNNLNVEAHCRVLLTTPLETFAVGNTIVISRGLIDVLPDEASLAMVLSDELAHIALGHRTNTQFAFHNQTMFSDEDLLERFRFARTHEEIAEAGAKAVAMLRNSPYKEKMSNAGLFLEALASRAPKFPNLIRANIGNQLADGSTIVRMGELLDKAPQLKEQQLDQIAALPLGSRVKLDPWSDGISLTKTKPVALLSAREKLFFEVTPFAPHLTRLEVAGDVAGTQ
jgi:hypothetical protein